MSNVKGLEKLAQTFVEVDVERGLPTKNVTEKNASAKLASTEGAAPDVVRVTTTLFSKEAYASATTLFNGVYSKVKDLCNDGNLLPVRKWPEVEKIKTEADLSLEAIKSDLRGRYESLKTAAKAARGGFYRGDEFPDVEDWLAKFKLNIKVRRFNPKGGEGSLLETLEKAVREEAEETAKASMKLVFDKFLSHLKRIKEGALGGKREDGKRAVLHSEWMAELTAMVKDLEDFVEVPKEALEKIEELSKMDKEEVREKKEQVTDMVSDLEKLMDGYSL